MPRTLLHRIAGLLLVAMLAAACGDGGAETAEETDTEVPATETEIEEATETEEAAGEGTEAAPAGDAEPLSLGYILPETGQLAYLGPPQIEAVNYAVEQINAAGGVLGNEIPAVVSGDEAGDEAIANQSADRLLAEDVDAVIGAAASGMSLAIIDKLTGAGVVQCSGSNTAVTFSEYDDDGYYIRTAPTDALQGPILAETIIADGAQSVVLMGRADDYGRGLVEAAEAALTEAGATVETVIYDASAQNFDADVQQALSANPDAVAVIAFDEGGQIIQGLIEGGLTADQLYGADGVRNTELPSLVDPNNPNVLDGMTGTAPAPESDQQFIEEFTAATGVSETQFAAQVYDCVNVIALAAEAAGSTDPADFREELVGVTTEGTACTSFAECQELIAGGEDIDYNGASGQLEFIESGEPGSGTYEVWSFENGELTTVDTVEATLPEAQA